MKQQTVFISKEFLGKLENFETFCKNKPNNIERGEFDSKELIAFKRIFNLFLQAELNTDYTEKDAIEFYKQTTSPLNNQKTYDQILIHKAIKENRFKCSALNLDDSPEKIFQQNAVYFLDMPQAVCESLSSDFGVSAMGIDFPFNDFFISSSIANYEDTYELKILEKVAFFGNSMIIVDKYIFTEGKNQLDKLPQVISSVKKFINPLLKIKFELIIITESQSNDRLYEKKSKQILNELGGKEKISLKIYAPNKLHSEWDRYIITNYSFISFGHPWDRNTTVTSSSIISQEKQEYLKQVFRTWVSKINLTKKIVDLTKSIPNADFVFESDQLKHRLLNF